MVAADADDISFKQNLKIEILSENVFKMLGVI